MCTPWTTRDWATCFLACRFPLDEEPDTFCISSAQASRGTTMVFNSIGDNKKGHNTNKNASRNNKSKREKEPIQSSTQSSNIKLEEKEIDDLSWPQFADEDYIVFCFREDGAIHVVKDEKPESSDHRMNRSSTRLVNSKLTCGEYAEQTYSSSSHDHHHHHHRHHMLMNEDERDSYPTNEATSILCNKKGKGKWSISMDTWPPSGGFGGDEKNDIEQEEEEEEISNKSSESNDQSDGSSSSFAFPVLSNEGVESPVQMPKPDALHFRKHNKARIHCCRF